MIKAMRPIDIRSGDMVYCGSTGKKKWRTVTKIKVESCWRYSIYTPDFGVSSGSGCKWLTKTKAKPHGF